MFKHNLTPCLNTQRPNKKGLYPLRIRATIKRVVSYYPTGIVIKKEQWDGTEVVKHPNKVSLNVAIRDKINELEKTFVDQYLSGEQGSKIQKIYNPTFGEYALKLIKDQTGVLSPGRIEQKEVYARKFAEFNQSIKITDVTKDTLIAFENFCRQRNNSENTIHSNTSFVKSVLNAARKDGVLQVNPVEGFKGAKYVNPFRLVLTSDELEKIEIFADNELNPKVMRSVASWFIFGAYTGLRYSDMARFKGFVNGRVLVQTEKTKEIVSLFATPKIIQAKARLTNDIISNQKMNSYLKLIAASLGIEKRVTVHQSRHFFGANFLQRGGDIYTLMKLMGHSNVKTTQIYSKVTNQFLDAEMVRVLG